MAFNVAPASVLGGHFLLRKPRGSFKRLMVHTSKDSQFLVIEAANIHISEAGTREVWVFLLKIRVLLIT